MEMGMAKAAFFSTLYSDVVDNFLYYITWIWIHYLC
jgi:hypothetical protein